MLWMLALHADFSGLEICADNSITIQIPVSGAEMDDDRMKHF